VTSLLTYFRLQSTTSVDITPSRYSFIGCACVHMNELKMMYFKRGFHLSIIPLPLTIKKCPQDHFCRRRFSLVSLLHAVGVASSQSCNRVLLLAWENISSSPKTAVRQSHDEFAHLIWQYMKMSYAITFDTDDVLHFFESE